MPGKYWKDVVGGAKQRQLEVTISIEDAWNKYIEQDGKCMLTGLTISFKKPTTASLDRIDSSVGYVPDNIQWVHRTVNKMKNDLPQDEFIAFCRMIADHAR